MPVEIVYTTDLSVCLTLAIPAVVQGMNGKSPTIIHSKY